MLLKRVDAITSVLKPVSRARITCSNKLLMLRVQKLKVVMQQ